MKVFQFIILIVTIFFFQSCYMQKVQQPSYSNVDFKNMKHAEMQAYFDDHNVITIPQGVYNVNGDLSINGNKTLILNGTLRGVKGNERILSDGDVSIKGSGTFERFSIEILGGAFHIQNVKFSHPGTTAAILINNDNKVLTNFVVDGVEIFKGPYGVLRQGAFGEKRVSKAVIKNCFIHDCRGDGIEWNVGVLDGPILIENNVIKDINSDKGGPVGKVWGIGIGLAGKQYDDNYEYCVRDFKIINNTISNVRQGIHVEIAADFVISGNKVSTNSKQSASGTLAVVGIVTYGCADFEISNNEVIAEKGRLAVWNSFGSLPKIGYLTPPKNYTIKNNIINGTVHNWCSGKDNTVEIFNNKINGKLEHFGAGIHKIYDNEIYPASSDEPAIKVDFFLDGKDKRKNYNALKKDAVLVEKNNSSAKKGVSLTKSIIKN